MKFSLSGQLKGPECRRVITQAIALRKKLDPWFEVFDGGNVTELTVILRVDGSFGSFGPEGVENIAIEKGQIECDIVIADQRWAELQDEEIAILLKDRVFEAVDSCFATVGVSYDADALAVAAS
jgi:hypothetical protein